MQDFKEKYYTKIIIKPVKRKLKICIKCEKLEYHDKNEKYCKECNKPYLDKLKWKIFY